MRLQIARCIAKTKYAAGATATKGAKAAPSKRKPVHHVVSEWVVGYFGGRRDISVVLSAHQGSMLEVDDDGEDDVHGVGTDEGADHVDTFSGRRDLVAEVRQDEVGDCADKYGAC